MPDIRIVKFEEKKLYAKVPNYAARDHRLSFGAKGLLVYFLSLPPKFIVLKKQIIKEQRVSRTLLDNFFSELETFGYLVGSESDQLKTKGEFSNKDYVVYSVPFNQIERIYQDPPFYPEKEAEPMLSPDIGQKHVKTDIFDEKPANSHEFTDAGILHRPMSGDSINGTSTPYSVLKEINNKLNLASQVVSIIEELKAKYNANPNSKKIPLKITAARSNSVKQRLKDFNTHWPSRDFLKACRFAFEYKAKEWAGDKMWKYFTPETLLSHFVEYLEEAEQNNGNPPVNSGKNPQQKNVMQFVSREEGTNNQHILDALYNKQPQQ